MTYDEVKNLINRGELVDAFAWLDDQVPERYQSVYASLQEEYIMGANATFSKRLLVFLSAIKKYLPEQTTIITPEVSPKDENLNITQKGEILGILEDKFKNFDALSAEKKGELYEQLQKMHGWFNEFDEKFKQDYPDIIFKNIVSQNELRPNEVNKLRSFVGDKEVKYHEKCVVVSALTLSLLKDLEFTRLDILIDFVNQSENNVWQRALLGLMLVLQERDQKLKGYPALCRKVQNLKDVVPVQQALFAIGQAYRKFQQDVMQQNVVVDLLEIFSKMRDADFFQKPQHWFLPFYSDNKIAIASLQNSKHNIDPGKVMTLLSENIAIGNADKYAICLYANTLTKAQMEGGFDKVHQKQRKGLINVLEEQKQRLDDLMNNAEIGQDFVQITFFEQYLMDLYQFLQHYPKERYEADILKSQQLYAKGVLELIAKDTAQLHIQAHQYLENEHYEEARTAYEKLSRLTPQAAEVWYNLGVVNYKLRAYHKAIEAYHEVVAIDAKDYRSWNNLGTAYFLNKESDKAIEAYQKAIALRPHKDEAWYNMGYLFFSRRNFTPALKAFVQVTKLNPNRADSWYNMGSIYLMQESYQQAGEAFTKVLELQPDKDDAWHNLGMSYIGAKNYDKALEAYGYAKQLKPELTEAWINMGYVYLLKSDLQNAKKHLTKAQELDKEPNDATLVNLGHIALIEGNELLALDFYERTLGCVDPKVFFDRVQDDIEMLEKQGVTKTRFEGILKKLKANQD